MKLIAVITLKMKAGILPQFIASLYKYGVGINYINLTETDEKWEDYSIEITYSVKKELIRLLDSLNKNTEYFRSISITSTLEDRIKGGLLKTSGKIDIENINDIETALLGGNRLIHEKIDAGLGKSYCGCFNSVGLISGHKTSRTNSITQLHHYYADSERDAVIINRFTGRNAFPCVIRYSSIEDLIRSLKSLEENFACIRLMKTDEEELPFSSIIDSVSRPIISSELDEKPLFYYSLIQKICAVHKMKSGETAIGIIGLSGALIRLAAILNKAGFAKVLGYDPRERIMMSFETRKGLATTVDNIISNCDIILLSDDHDENNIEEKMQPGQIFISENPAEKSPEDLVRHKGLKDYIVTGEHCAVSLIPGMLNGIFTREERFYSDEMLLKLGEFISKNINDKYMLPGLFSEFNENLESEVQRL
jgi:hypothetical protein